MSELIPDRTESRESYRQRIMDIIAGRAIIQVIENHGSIITVKED